MVGQFQARHISQNWSSTVVLGITGHGWTIPGKAYVSKLDVKWHISSGGSGITGHGCNLVGYCKTITHA